MFGISALAHAEPASPQASVPIRALSAPSAVTTEPLRNILGAVRQVPGGKLMVNDAIGHRLLMFDSTLKNFTAIRDFASASQLFTAPDD